MDATMMNGSADAARLQAGASKMNSLAASAKQAKNLAQIEAKAQEFESVFISQMMEHMFAGVDADPMGEDPGSETYRSMLNEEYGKLISKAGGIGIADHVKREMLAMQEGKK